MKKILLIIVLLCSGCVSNKEFWHPDKRVRIKPTIQVDYTDEKDAMRYYLLERMHAFQRATTPLESSSLPSKANLADGERGALLFIGEKK